MKTASLAVVLLLSVGGCGLSGLDDPAPTPTPALVGAAVFTVDGSVGVPLDDWSADEGATCVGEPGYSDIREGSEVTVEDERGAILAGTRLGEGAVDGFACRYTFVLEGVAEGKRYYIFRIGNGKRGIVKETRADLSDDRLDLMLS